jgi:hypothetical protein
MRAQKIVWWCCFTAMMGFIVYAVLKNIFLDENRARRMLGSVFMAAWNESDAEFVVDRRIVAHRGCVPESPARSSRDR